MEAIHDERFLIRSDAKYQVFDYILVYYNRKRLHSNTENIGNGVSVGRDSLSLALVL